MLPKHTRGSGCLTLEAEEKVASVLDAEMSDSQSLSLDFPITGAVAGSPMSSFTVPSTQESARSPSHDPFGFGHWPEAASGRAQLLRTAARGLSPRVGPVPKSTDRLYGKSTCRLPLQQLDLAFVCRHARVLPGRDATAGISKLSQATAMKSTPANSKSHDRLPALSDIRHTTYIFMCQRYLSRPIKSSRKASRRRPGQQK